MRLNLPVPARPPHCFRAPTSFRRVRGRLQRRPPQLQPLWPLRTPIWTLDGNRFQFGLVEKIRKWPIGRISVSHMTNFHATFGPIPTSESSLGAASTGLVDVNIDHDSAKKLTGLLPPTERVHGRPPSNPDTHYWYQVAGAGRKDHRLQGPAYRRGVDRIAFHGGADRRPTQPLSAPRRNSGDTLLGEKRGSRPWSMQVSC